MWTFVPQYYCVLFAAFLKGKRVPLLAPGHRSHILGSQIPGMPMSPTRILFVCLGNICRSPAAEGVFRTLVAKAGREQDFVISSAGTLGYHAGSLADPRMRRAAGKRGYALTSRARQFEQADFHRHDLILAMDGDNLRSLLSQGRTDADREKVRSFCDFCVRMVHYKEVPDPYYGEAEGFEEVLDLLEDGCTGLLAHYSK